jgi:hypothetical protein
VWGARTDPTGPERLGLGHERETEASLYHCGVRQWLAGRFDAAAVLLEALLAAHERHVRDPATVASLLALAHLTGPIPAETREALAGQLLPGRVNARGAALDLDVLAVRDALGRPPGEAPATMLPLCAAVGQALRTNRCLRELDLAGSAIGPAAAADLCLGAAACVSLTLLNLSGNRLGHGGGGAVGALLAASRSLLDLDVGRNGLEDPGFIALADGLACGARCRNSTLRRLAAADNEVTADGAVRLSLSLKAAGAGLRALDLSGNGVGCRGAGHLADAVFLGLPLVSLALGDCDVGADGAARLAEAAAASTSLARLALGNTRRGLDGAYSRGNRFDDDAAAGLARALGASGSLTALDLGGGSFGPTVRRRRRRHSSSSSSSSAE